MATVDPSIIFDECDQEDLAAMIAIRDRNPKVLKALASKARWAQQQRDWRVANAKRVCERQRGYSARRRATTRVGLSGTQTREWALARPKVCHWCRKRCAKDFHIDHIVALARGGLHEARNLCISCPTCNLSKGAKDPLTFARNKGLLL
jgi:5-methylcytosine-specific restriction endonuclease McrA